MSLFWRVYAVNAVVLAVAAVVLVLTPATVSFPVVLTEAAVLTVGIAALLTINLALLRRIFRPLRRLTAFVREVDPLEPGSRAPSGSADAEIAELTDAVNDMMERLETERRDSARRALGAQERERLRIARELHDEVGQALTAVMLELEHAAGRTGPAAAGELAQTREEVRAALENVREIARRLRPEALDDLGLPAALRSLVSAFERRTAIRVERDIGSPGTLTEEQELVAYRIAQEALTNASRHSGATAARVELGAEGTGAVLTVEDDGRGFDRRRATRGAGLRGMRERAVLAGARLEVESEPGRGTRVRLRLERSHAEVAAAEPGAREAPLDGATTP